MRPAKLLAPALLCSLALSGGLVQAPAGAAGETITPVAGPPISFGPATKMIYNDPLYGAMGGPGEPSIKLDSKGTIYIGGVCCVPRPAPVWYSRDDGRSFQPMTSPAGAREYTIGAEGDWVVDDADHALFTDTAVPALVVSRWSEHGASWDYSYGSQGIVPGMNDRPWLTYSKGRHFVYINHLTHITTYKSVNGGHTWGQAYSTAGQGQRYWPGNVAADRRTDWVHMFGSCGSNATQFCANNSSDGGTTWKEVRLHEAERGAISLYMVSMDVDEAGNVYAAYSTTNPTGCDVYVASSSDHGSTWRSYKVSPATGCATFPWIAAGSPGRVSLAYFYNASRKNQNEVPASSNWELRADVIDDANTERPVQSEAVFNEFPVHQGPLGRSLWDFIQIAIGPDGRFHIAFVEDTITKGAHPGGFSDKATWYVGQAGGPRALVGASQRTAVESLSAEAVDGRLRVAGTTELAAPGGRARVADDELAEAAPGLDLGQALIDRPAALAPELRLQLFVNGLPDVADHLPGIAYTWPLSVDGKTYMVTMQGTPRVFTLCAAGGACQDIRGDFDGKGDRIVAYVPLSAISAGPGSVVAAAGQIRNAGDSAAINKPFTVPGATVNVKVTDRDGSTTYDGPATLGPDGAFAVEAPLGAAPHTVVATACSGGLCAEGSPREA